MMIFSGVLGLCQSLFLPALIVMKLAKLRGGLIERLIRLFPLSLLCTYLGVYLLCLLHVYTRPVVFALIALEWLAVLRLYRKTLTAPIRENLNRLSDALRKEFEPLRSDGNSGAGAILGRWIWIGAGCMALSGVIWAIHLVRLNVGTVFSGWDTLFSWNAYAEMWAGGGIPLVGGMYPQLVAANWSVSYVLQGADAVQFFNTLLPPLFFLMIELMLFDLGFQRRESGFFFAAVICRYMMKKLLGDGLFDGYMDAPAAAMCLLVFYTFLKAEGRDADERRQCLVLGLIFAAEAAVTKQSGFIALAIAPVMTALWMKDDFAALPKRRKVLLIALMLLIVLPWYAHCQLTRGQAGEQNLIAEGITSFNESYDIHHKLNLAREALGKYVLVFILALVGVPLIPRKYRLPLILFSVPLTVIWAVYYTYDARNLAAALPFVSIMAGLAIAGLGRLCAKLPLGGISSAVFILIAVAAAAFGLRKLCPDDKLTADQVTAQKEIFGARLNAELLYGVFGEEHGGKDIYTDYPAYFLPGYSECCSSADLTDTGQMSQVLAGEKVQWMLLPEVFPNNTDGAKAIFDQCVADGVCVKQACSDGYYKNYCLYQVNRK